MTLKNYAKGFIPKLLLIFTVLCSQTAAAQNFSPDRVTVSMPTGMVKLSDAFRDIERQTLFRFAFTGDRLDVDKKVELSKTEYTVTEIVERLLTGTGYTYTLRQTHFIIVPRQELSRQRTAAAAVPQQPVIIDERDLKRFVSDEQRGGDSVIRRTIEVGPFVYNAPEQHFPTPGELFAEGKVPPQFSTAERWQRSKLALKTNVLYGAAALAPNLRAEFGLNNRTTLELGVSYNGWNLKGSAEDNRKLVHGIGMAEYRYWLCERFSGHFFGVHGFGAFYNVGGYKVPLLFEKEFRYEGTAFGGGVSYGYMLPFAKRWGIEFNVGLGLALMKYDKYGCNKCDDKIGSFRQTYFGPTRAGITLVFQIK